MYQECRHVMPSGLHCQSPAMRGSAFCYYHGRAQRPARPARLREARIELPDTLDSNGIRKALHAIMNALGSGFISSRRAGILLYALQMASASGPAAPVPDSLLPATIDATGLSPLLLAELNAVVENMAAPVTHGNAGKAKTLRASRL